MNLTPLREDLKRAKDRLQAQKLSDRDNEVALAMYSEDVKRAQQELQRHIDKGQPVRWPLMVSN